MLFKGFLLSLCGLLSFPLPVFAQQPVKDQEILSKVLQHLQAHYFRSLTPVELQAKSLNELFSKLDKETHLEPAKPSELDFVRGLKEEKSIARVERFENHVGYVQISFLGRRTAHDFDKVLSRFIRDGVQNLILDLRGNPGGSLNSGIGVIEHLIPSGKLLFTFYGQGGVETKEYSQGTKIEPIKVTVLIDRKTASTAEMMADALKRYAYAQLIGEPTYGKRSVQGTFPVDPFHTLFLTTGHFVLPEESQIKIQPDVRASSGECLQKALRIITGKG